MLNVDYMKKMCSETFQKQNTLKDLKDDIKLYNLLFPCYACIVSFRDW